MTRGTNRYTLGNSLQRPGSVSHNLVNYQARFDVYCIARFQIMHS